MQRWGAPFLVIHRGDLQMVLLEAAEEGSRHHADMPWPAAGGYPRHGRDHVTAVFSKYGEEIEVEAPLLIAADGIWSRARGHVGLTARPIFPAASPGAR
jgi:salicylate hydroxylase